jgi:hypothetical protein
LEKKAYKTRHFQAPENSAASEWIINLLAALLKDFARCPK